MKWRSAGPQFFITTLERFFGWISFEESAHQIQSCLKSHLEMPLSRSNISKIEASFWNIFLLFLTKIYQILQPQLSHLKYGLDVLRSCTPGLRIRLTVDEAHLNMSALLHQRTREEHLWEPGAPPNHKNSQEIWKFYAPSKCHHSVGPWQRHLVIVWSPPVAATFWIKSQGFHHHRIARI